MHLLHLDSESLDSVRTCAAELQANPSSLNIVIENAGIRNVPAGKTKDGFELHWGTNNVIHFLLLQLLSPLLIASSTEAFHSRAIIVVSTAHRNAPMDFADLN